MHVLTAAVSCLVHMPLALPRPHALRIRACEPPPSLFEEELNLIYDGRCAVCEWEKANLLSLGAAGKIRFTDLEDASGYEADLPSNGGVSYESAMSRITAVTREGQVLTGMRVFAACYERVGLGWLFVPLQWPIVGALVELAYEAFAAVRTDITRGSSLRKLVALERERGQNYDWRGFERHAIGGLKRPLLVARGSRGFAACGYIDVETANKLDEACVVFMGVDTCDDFVEADVVCASNAAVALGVRCGMCGRDALELLR